MNSAIYHRWPRSITFPIHSAFKFKSKEDCSSRDPGAASPGGWRGDLPSCHFFPTRGDHGAQGAEAAGSRGPRGRRRGGGSRTGGGSGKGGGGRTVTLSPAGPGRRCGHAGPRPSVPHPPAASATRPGGPCALRPTAAPPRPGPGKGGAAHRSPGRKLPGAAGRSRPPRASSTRAAIFAPEPEAPSARVPLTAPPPRPLPRPGRAD